MKLQIQESSLRVRVDEKELAELMGGEILPLDVAPGSPDLFSLRVRLADSLAFAVGDGWRLDLPKAEVLAYAASLPRREALTFALAPGRTPLSLHFEVDVRDSRKLRGPRSA